MAIVNRPHSQCGQTNSIHGQTVPTDMDVAAPEVYRRKAKRELRIHNGGRTGSYGIGGLGGGIDNAHVARDVGSLHVGDDGCSSTSRGRGHQVLDICTSQIPSELDRERASVTARDDNIPV